MTGGDDVWFARLQLFFFVQPIPHSTDRRQGLYLGVPLKDLREDAQEMLWKSVQEQGCKGAETMKSQRLDVAPRQAKLNFN